MTDPIAVAVAYHQRTKHLPNRYARSLGFMDWANQPDPFLSFDGAPRIDLDLVPAGGAGAGAEPQPLSRELVSQLLRDSLALSAWKAAGANQWSLRCNPSSGNLHPTEGYLLAGSVPGLGNDPGLLRPPPPTLARDPAPPAPTPPGCYHYNPYAHALELRRPITSSLWQQLCSGLPEPSLLIGLSSIHWRESWKYGERAFRYCHLDTGHAIAAIAMAAAVLGWTTRLLEAVSSADLETLLALGGHPPEEAEHGDCLLLLTPDRQAGDQSLMWQPPAPVLQAISDSRLQGTPNRLSRNHVPWPVIDQVAAATRRDQPPRSGYWQPQAPARSTYRLEREQRVRTLIHQRRSAIAMDGETVLHRDGFLRIVGSLTSAAPLSALPWRPALHPLLWVHRVEGIPAGAYLLVRDPDVYPALQAALDRRFRWTPVADADGLYHLESGDFQDLARDLSCHQDIASDGAFAVAFLADFEGRISEHGAWFYRRLLWEAGLLGQLLYLHAEAEGVRGTGIGCFFDDLVHQYLGLTDHSWQSVYHFTIGGAIDDPRLQSLDPYHHLSP
jgi:nitroreductase